VSDEEQPPEKITLGSDKEAWTKAAVDIIRFTEKRADTADIAATLVTHTVFVYAVHQEDPVKALTAQIKYLAQLLTKVVAATAPEDKHGG
jgi:hypothetical protein